MLFNSAVFILLFLIFYILYWPLPVRYKHVLIIIASILFYGWYSFTFLVLFLFILVFSYLISIPILKSKSRLFLTIGLIVVFGNLAFFKYFYLLAQSYGVLIDNEYVSNLKQNWAQDYNFTIVLPIAISFYTFQIVAYLVDCYRGTISERIIFRKYVVFILYFPQFIAGPIMRSTDFIAQIDNPKPSQDRMLNGSLLILQGILKKVLIADQIGAAIGPVFVTPEKYDFTILLLLSVAFMSQIYADFSGYTDMARGMSKLLGYEIPENFKGPLVSKSFTELWRRWHITLSTWLRDYIFFPLGGTKVGNSRAYFNLLVTMGIGGLWHGANWTMLIWGLYMGGVLCLERYLRQKELRILPETTFGNAMRITQTYILFGFSGLFFASPGIEQAIAIFKGIFTLQRGMIIPKVAGVTILSLVVLGLNFLQYSDTLQKYLHNKTRLRYALIGIGTFVIGMLVNMYGDTSGSFIYFAF